MSLTFAPKKADSASDAPCLPRMLPPEGNLVEKIMDKIDSRIITLLKQDGRMPNTELAKRLSLSETTIRKRLKKLIESETIQIVAVVNQQKLGEEIRGNIKIKVDSKKTDRIIRGLKRLKPIWYIAHLAGAVDFDVEFSVRNHLELRDLLSDINKIEGVIRTQTSFRLQLIKNRYDWETPKL
jgi:Lrp/AsnC family transcriptional regulator for asnA, asnC and gidA